jgi:hypothetical protein
MPTYTFENTKTGKQHTELLSILEMEEFLKKNKNFRQVITSINIVSGVQGVTFKNDNGWKENMARIAEAHPASPLADRYGKRSIKEVKTREVIKKHAKRITKGLK